MTRFRGRGRGRARGPLPRSELPKAAERHAPKKAAGAPRARRGTHGLARCLSKLGFASRTDAAALVRAGRVTVNGRVERDPERRTDPARETIAVDGRTVRARETIVLAMNKPAGAITTWSDERGRATVYHHLPADLDAWVFPVGRLDAETTGLLLFTNDTRLGDVLTSERFHVEKVYEVTAKGILDDAALARLERGVDIGGHVTLPARVEAVDRGRAGATRFRLAIREGKNRQVRRMVEAVGSAVLELRRVRVGPIALGDLAPGATRRLRADEVRALRALVPRPS